MLRLTATHKAHTFRHMADIDFDQLLAAYKQAIDHWVDAIHAEESLATADHSMVEMERWDDAGFKLDEAGRAAKDARDAYKDALRTKNYGF